MTETFEPIPKPEHPLLAAWVSALDDGGYWAHVLDAQWRYVYETDELRSTFIDMGKTGGIPTAIGAHIFSTPARAHFAAAVHDYFVGMVTSLGPYVLASTPGGRDELLGVTDPSVHHLVEAMEAQDVPDVWIIVPEWTTAGAAVTGTALWFRIKDDDGETAGYCVLSKPAAGMSHLARAAAIADLAHLDRMRLVAPDRRPAAILMADLESSTPLSRRMSSAQYFAFGRRLVRMADQCIIDEGGIVGRHAGDGVVGFFLAEAAGSESAAARGCIAAARALQRALPDVARRSEIPEAELSLRFGLHWGGTLYIGQILTRGRSEVTALGDEVNEAARIEACATGGRILASKALVERLTRPDADALGLDPAHTSYTLLADLPTATEKARRDAPSIAVCDVP
jgi:class 3 adenylate cyclase